MPAAVAVDTLALSKRLKQAGFDERQTEELVSVIVDTTTSDRVTLATKADLRAEINDLRADMRQSNAEMRREMYDIKAEIIKWGVGALLVQTGFITALLLRLVH